MRGLGRQSLELLRGALRSCAELGAERRLEVRTERRGLLRRDLRSRRDFGAHCLSFIRRHSASCARGPDGNRRQPGGQPSTASGQPNTALTVRVRCKRTESARSTSSLSDLTPRLRAG